MTGPNVYRAINAVAAELSGAGIPKLHRNRQDDYLYRSIDDVLNRLSPLLAKHRLCVLPRVLERSTMDRTGDGDLLLLNVVLKVAFDIVSSKDGSSHTVVAFGEALDGSDKATAKATSSAYKYAMLQLFCVPVAQIGDADSSTHRLKRDSHVGEPVEGWPHWAAGIIDIAMSCVTQDALDRLQERQRALLKAISRERPDLYAQIGEAFARCGESIRGAACTIVVRSKGEQRAKTSPEIGEERAIPLGENGEDCAIPADANGERCANPSPAKTSAAKANTKAPSRLRQKRGTDEPAKTAEPA